MAPVCVGEGGGGEGCVCVCIVEQSSNILHTRTIKLIQDHLSLWPRFCHLKVVETINRASTVCTCMYLFGAGTLQEGRREGGRSFVALSNEGINGGYEI